MTVVEEDFLEEDLDQVEPDTEVVVIDFSATWCGPCQRYDPVFDRLAEDMLREHAEDPVAFLHVDVDKNKALARELGVKSVPTTVITVRERGLLWGHRWREKARFSGIVPYPRLMEAVSEQLEGLEA